MKLFILAAGKGTRLWPLTKNTPKSLLDLGDGTTLLERQIEEAIRSKLFDEIVIITGYKSEQIEAKVEDYRSKISIKTIYNPFYDTTNNLVSLWTAHYMMKNQDFMITNGDNIYKNGVFNKVFEKVKNKKEIIAITIDYKEKYDEDDMKVIIDEEKNVVKVHKEIPIEKVNAESVGLSIVKGEKSREIFIKSLLEMIKDKKALKVYWLDLFNYIISKRYKVQTVEIEKDEWKEIDFHPDIDILKNLILNNKF